MSKILTVIAQIEAKKKELAYVKAEIIKLIEPTRREEGCIVYELHQDNENETLFIFVEKWQNRELWQKHMQSKHLNNFIVNTENILEKLIVNEMSEIL